MESIYRCAVKLPTTTLTLLNTYPSPLLLLLFEPRVHYAHAVHFQVLTVVPAA